VRRARWRRRCRRPGRPAAGAGGPGARPRWPAGRSARSHAGSRPGHPAGTGAHSSWRNPSGTHLAAGRPRRAPRPAARDGERCPAPAVPDTRKRPKELPVRSRRRDLHRDSLSVQSLRASPQYRRSCGGRTIHESAVRGRSWRPLSTSNPRSRGRDPASRDTETPEGTADRQSSDRCLWPDPCCSWPSVSTKKATSTRSGTGCPGFRRVAASVHGVHSRPQVTSRGRPRGPPRRRRPSTSC
jgi:hypothetical protein